MMGLKSFFLLIGLLAGFCFQAQTLHLYGGADQDQYLGCLTCDQFDKNSIWNKFSDYGNVFNSKSMIRMEISLGFLLQILINLKDLNWNWL